MLNFIIIFPIILLSSIPVESIIAYDCSHPGTNTTALSLLSVKPCDIQDYNPEVSYSEIQLLQLNEIQMVHVFQCKIVMTRLITYCGHSSHAYIVKNGYKNTLLPISQEECNSIHRTKTFLAGRNRLISEIPMNTSFSTNIFLAGKADESGTCQGEYYSDGESEWGNVVVTAHYEFITRDYQTQVRMSDDQVIMSGQISCPYSKGSCLDIQNGYTFWNLGISHECTDVKYDVLWQGSAEKAIM